MRDQVELHNGRRWYAVATQPGREAVAREDLASQDFEVFLPILIEIVGHPRRGTYRRTRPVFGPYLFVHVDPAATHWHCIVEARAVVGLVCAAGVPLAARKGPIEMLQRLALDGDGTIWIAGYDEEGKPDWRAGPIVKAAKRLPFEPGQPLRITGGPFQYLSGLYVGGEGEHLKLSIDTLGRKVVTELPEALVVPA
jgi:transcription antitermination factor NusG